MTPPRRTRRTLCQTPIKNDHSSFAWGTPTKHPESTAISRGLRYYKSFTWESQVYRVGDYVLISNGDDDKSPFVAKLEELCDTTDSRKNMNYEGKVTWYARRDELLGMNVELNLGSNEVVLVSKAGSRAPNPSVDLETICGICYVKEVHENTAGIAATDGRGRQQFFCRYMLMGHKKLKPLIASGSKTPSKNRSEESKTPAKGIDGHRSLLLDKEAVVIVEDCMASPPKNLRLRLRKNGKENYETVTPSKAPNTVEEIAGGVRVLTLANTSTKRAEDRNKEIVNTPRSSKTERTTTATRSGRIVRNLDFSVGEKKSGELSDEDLISGDEEANYASGNESSSEDSEEEISSDEETPKRLRPSKKSGNRSAKKTPTTRFIVDQKTPRTPSMPSRRKKTHDPQTDIEKALSKLHVCAVPSQLPCREDQFAEIYDFVEGKLVDQVGSCMYISGVPGTGKTATVREVIKALQDAQEEGAIPEFKFIEINGMKLSEPNQAYVQILRQLDGRKATADSAADILTGIFKSKRKSSDTMTVLLVDELDLLWTRKQQVLYNIFDWPTHPNSRLLVVAIANTMDLPERMVMNKVASRMGLSRMTFQPYTFQELQEIVKARLSGLELMDPDAVQFISRKVAALSGDARRALDVCRRAVELSETCDEIQASPSKRARRYTVSMVHVNRAVKEMFTSSKIVAMQALSFHEKLALRAIVAEFRRTGVEECVFHNVNGQYKTLARLEGASPLNASLLSRILARMASSRLLILSDPRNDFQQKISLNATADDVNFALRAPNDCDD